MSIPLPHDSCQLFSIIPWELDDVLMLFPSRCAPPPAAVGFSDDVCENSPLKWSACRQSESKAMRHFSLWAIRDMQEVVRYVQTERGDRTVPKEK